MSFRCEKCNYAQAPGVGPVKRVVTIRKRSTISRMHQLPNGLVIDMHGVETVLEMDLCASCAQETPDALQVYRAERDAEIGFKLAYTSGVGFHKSRIS